MVSDWSSDVCSSDLQEFQLAGLVAAGAEAGTIVALDPDVWPAQGLRQEIGRASCRERV